MIEVPAEYQGRVQSWLKHRVLEEYLLVWGHKLGSLARRGRVRLCYVDGFAGPWQAKDDELSDTSIAISLDALEKAANTWREKGHSVDVFAYFVEKDQQAFGRLKRFLDDRSGLVRAQCFNGEFKDHVEPIRRWLGDSPSFVFVDPTGWKGAAMRFIAPLLAGSQMRDVLVNVMFDHINRFKDDPRRFLRQQMRDFFGLDDQDLPEALDEEGLFALYRSQLKTKCKVAFAADLAIPHPTLERTKFRLVVGGNSPKVLEVFRGVEKKVIGVEAGAAREEARRRSEEEKTKQMSLLTAPPAVDSRYESLHAQALGQAPGAMLSRLQTLPSAKFDELWPELLEGYHLTKGELADLVWEMVRSRDIHVLNKKPGERSIKGHHELSRRPRLPTPKKDALRRREYFDAMRAPVADGVDRQLAYRSPASPTCASARSRRAPTAPRAPRDRVRRLRRARRAL
jgi:three-Cys-motif partner protein